MQAVPSSPLFSAVNPTQHIDKPTCVESAAAVNPTQHIDKPTCVESAAADAAAPSDHTASQDTAVLKSTQQLPKSHSNDDAVDKLTVTSSVPSKRGAGLFHDDDADDLFASPAPSKVLAVFCHNGIL